VDLGFYLSIIVIPIAAAFNEGTLISTLAQVQAREKSLARGWSRSQ